MLFTDNDSKIKYVDENSPTLSVISSVFFPVTVALPSFYNGMESRTLAVAKFFADLGYRVNLLASRGSSLPDPNIRVLTGNYRSWGGQGDTHPYELEKDLILENLDEIKDSDAVLEDNHFKYCNYLKSKNPEEYPKIGLSWDFHPDQLSSLSSYPQNIFCVSKWQMSTLREKFKNQSHNFYLAYSGLILENYPKDIDFNEKEENLYLYLARFSKVKGPHIVIELAKENPNDNFVMLGDVTTTGEGGFARQIKKDADDLDNLKVIFNCSYDEKIEYLRKATGLLHPGLWCVPSYETVMTKNGNMSISKIEVGDEVLTHDGSFQKVLNKFSKYNTKNLIRVHPHYSTPFDVTPEHKIMTKNGYKNANELTINDELLRVQPPLAFSNRKSLYQREYVDFPNVDLDNNYAKIYKLESIPYIGMVYDIEVENNHNFCLSDIVVSNSEPLGFNMLEGLYFGAPVLAFDRGSPREIYQNEKQGLIVPFKNLESENIENYKKAFRNFKKINFDPQDCRNRVLKRFDFKKNSFPKYQWVLGKRENE